jgi:hypothetical protein
MITLEEAKKYLRVDANDEDDVIQQELDAAESLVASVLRKDSLEMTKVVRLSLWQSFMPLPILTNTGRKRIITP